ncbi:tRNA (adenosine(37)-N6)-threonylcarbamoyltransferase complex dimerization subunit type 1 TsaB [Flavobacterium sp. NST-5]|uniref:tRNA (Adenosine(37)-N6)-threonylcarbamoyltransferase complex dimerization subunit type 1 TsaB n=1 Tax=Flavobacterium ichthyis TaxID=2698827 RepID=A0ABW9ZAA7_9FLAO|nr:tRNA (adenosine(37)-N6)-threonylcarbamoyltransferase complex dimerization subunit type 1 TsaB [Flavobacterium ichthyis]NBL65534.1 tRNA (adenosine(37)-N6)-threonylcarbamoyltransferase complex dimerization subunit type 1 TsaB [Flavobacterium ichthyis]
MAVILNIETSTKNCSVGIAQDGKLLHLREFADEGYAHAEKLHIFIAESLAAVSLTPKDLTAIAVSKGPGSYTGLRIGVSAAKGLCYVLNIPLISVDTLAVLAAALTIDGGVKIPMIDARRMEVYHAIFSPSGEMLQDAKAEIITGESFSILDLPIHLLGDGAEKCAAVLPNGKFVFHPEIQYPSAREMASLSFDKYKKSDTENVAYFEPFYLKDFLIQSKS